MKRMMGLLSALLLIISCGLFSCRGDPQPVQTSPVTDIGNTPVQQAPASNSQPPPAPAEVFNPASISKEEKDTAMLEIQQLIQRLNGIIRARNYNAWVSYLDPGYFALISSPDHLEQISKSAVLVRQRITLKSAQDYFNHVVVPSRTNSRVDDIEFISQNRVKAYMMDNTGTRLRLYDLEKTVAGWKIIN
jgi:hypothetical protein